MEDISLLRSVLKQRNFMTTRFKGCISNCHSRQKIENLSSLCLEGCALPIHLPPFWPLFFGQNFHPKAVKPVIAFLGAIRIRLLIFLDDILIMASSHKLAMQHTDLVIKVLTSVGFVINFPKSILIASKVLPYLLFKAISDLMKLFLLREKLLNLKQFAPEILFRVPTASLAAGFLGLCQ